MKKVAALAGVTTVLSLGIASPALAEGDWSSELKGVAVGFSSRSWQDSHLDNHDTWTTFTTCTKTGGPAFTSADITLYDEYGALPDQSKGTKTNTCNKSNWGEMTRSDMYHWTVSAYSNSGNGYKLNVKTVAQHY